MTRHYCCYFDHRYLDRGLAMIRSLRRFERESPVWVLCLDEECRRLLERLQEPGVAPIALADFEAGDEELAAAKANRSLIEYYFTLTPSLVRYVLRRSSAGDSVTYVDGDLFFFADPAPLHEELGEGAVAIVGHRFPDRLRAMERYGKYNVGWLTFRHSERGFAVAEWWRDRCNEWCYDVVEADRFADQKYLDRFPALFDGVVVLEHKGADVAPWNLERYRLSEAENGVLVDGVPLIFFHYHGLRRLTSWAYAARHSPFGAPFGRTVRRALYRPYVRALVAIQQEIRTVGGASQAQVLRRDDSVRLPVAARIKARARRAWGTLQPILRGEVLLVLPNRCI